MRQHITHYCTIKNAQVLVDGELLFQGKKESEATLFFKEIYKNFKIDYPKFYKMDPLCKLSVLASNLLFEKVNKIDSNTAIVLSNRSSCIDIDEKHQASIQHDVSGARPANFVYTLPNIALGEISIKHGLRSENSFFIFDDFNPQFLTTYSKSLIQLKKCESILCGWVEVNKEMYDCFMFLIEPEAGMELNVENLLKLR